MNIFITWSGPRSYAVAGALKEYLPLIVNDFTPWLSKENIDKGAYWGAELTSALANSMAGIICLTPSNLTEPWILFEAGAIAKTVAEKPLACTLLIGLESSDITGPLTLFQDTKPTREDLLKLVKTLNKALGKDAVKEAQVEQAFDLVWPKLEERLANLPSDKSAVRPKRPEDEMIREILDTVRSTSQHDAAIMDRLVTVVEKLTTPKPIGSAHSGAFDRGAFSSAFDRLNALGGIQLEPDKIPTGVLDILRGPLATGTVTETPYVPLAGNVAPPSGKATPKGKTRI